MIKIEPKKICGLVMPISAIDGCNEGHWNEVLKIVTEAIVAADFEANMVSDADDVGIIQKRIIQNLYDNPIVVCDVSAKNPNVMFELGMRLAFDKPTIIIKDDKTAYSFDTASIEHIEYPRDLRFSKIIDFKNKLTEKIIGTYSKSTIDKNYTTFLKHFGAFTVAKIDHKEVSGQEFILEELQNIKTSVRNLEKNNIRRLTDLNFSNTTKNEISYFFKEYDMLKMNDVILEINEIKSILNIEYEGHRDNSVSMKIYFDSRMLFSKNAISEQIEQIFEKNKITWQKYKHYGKF